MRSLNRVELIGRLGADPDIRYTQTGDAVATISLATNEQWADRTTGEAREQTEWHRCILWKRLAEIAQQYLRKGSRIYAAGQLKTRKWQDQSGQDRYTTEIQVRDIMMLDGQDAPQQTAQPSQYQQRPVQPRQPSAAPAAYQPPAPSYPPAASPPAQTQPQHQPSPTDQVPFDDDIPF